MRFTTVLAAAASLAVSHVAQAAHGDGDEGTIMGPVAFLWPDDRSWDAADDNISPCGSADGVGNRTDFPLTGGSVALSIADDAYFVAFYISYSSYPTSQVQFSEQIVSNVTEIYPGHQCYKIEELESTAAAGSNATIQLQYWADYGTENDGKNETFYACADITFVTAEDFDIATPCFNVTASNFEGGVDISSSTAATATATSGSSATGDASSATTTASDSSSSSSQHSSSGLSGGQKAGIAVGSIVGGLALIGIAIFIYLRSRRVSYIERRRRAGLNDPIPLAKRNVEGNSINSR